jgi:uncharacterized protein (DUF342 family)
MSDTTITGNLQLDVDESGLEARIVYTPSSDGEQWDVEKLKRLLNEEKITEGVDEKTLESTIDDLAKQPEKRGDGEINKQTVLIAEGTPAQDPVPEKVNWLDLPKPEDIKEDIERFLQDVDAPNITKERVKKVKTKKKVQKKQKFPFMQPKEEVEEVTEKQKVQEPVEVDPEVEDYGWAEQGQKLATVAPGRPGKPGKDVYGTPIMPVSETEEAVYPGQGTEKEKSDVVAKESGVVRRGKNWVEVLPFRRHSWDMYLSKDKATCYLTFTPGNEYATPPTPGQLFSKVEELGYPEEHLLSGEELEEMILSAIREQKELSDEIISTDKDASIDLHITDDKTKALLSLEKGRGRGKPLSLKEVGKTIRESGLKGVKIEKVKKDLMEFYRSSRFSMEDYVLAEGSPPEESEDGTVSMNVTFLGEQEREELREQITNTDNTTFPEITSTNDFHILEVEEMAFVIRHQTVAKLEPGKKGKDGKDVFGNTLASRKPKEPQVKLLENLVKEENVIQAQINGLLEKGKHAETVLLRVRPHKDGEAEVTVSEDKMRAYLTMYPAEGMGKAPGDELIKKRLAEKGVKKGVDEETIEDAVKRAASGEKVVNLLVAKGREPQHASENQIEFHVNFPSRKKVTIKEDGRADYKTHDTMVLVNTGDVVATILPPEVEPSDGWDITGKSHPAKKKQGIDIEIGKNVKQEPQDDGSVNLVAEKDGKLLYDKKQLAIQDVHVVDGNVDLKSGNIKFKGPVEIKGDVESGFYVVSGDSITVKEGVEAALLTCEKDLSIAQGVKGGGKAVLRAKNTIQATFIERAKVLAVGDVQVKNFCLQSDVKSNGKVTLETEKGSFIGGSVRARKGLDVMNLGSKSGMRTEVFFGQDYLIADQIGLEEKEIEKIKKKIMDYDSAMNRLEKEGKTTKLEKIRKEKLKLMKIMEKRSFRLFTFRERFEEHFPSEVQVRGTLYPGVVIESHGRYYEPKEEKTSIKLVFDQESGQIKEEPLTK